MADELTEKAYAEIFRLCNGGKWKMSIPVNETNDSDCVIISGIKAAEHAAYLRALDDVLDKLADGHLISVYVLDVLEGMKADYKKEMAKWKR